MIMGVQRKEGYEYRGWKLGEEVRYKSNNINYKIIGFCEEENKDGFIAINRDSWRENIKNSIVATSYIDTASIYFEWVSEDEIEKIENVVEERNKEVMEKINQYEAVKEEVQTSDVHIKPDHYKVNIAGNECEVKDVIKAVVKDYDSFNVGNIIKYVMRYQKKNGLEDLKKARTYLDELISEK